MEIRILIAVKVQETAHASLKILFLDKVSEKRIPVSLISYGCCNIYTYKVKSYSCFSSILFIPKYTSISHINSHPYFTSAIFFLSRGISSISIYLLLILNAIFHFFIRFNFELVTLTNQCWFLFRRRGRGRQETKSPNQETARSSVRSSMSDLSSAPGKDVPSECYFHQMLYNKR